MTQDRPTDGWEPEIEELKRRMALARQMGGTENLERQRKAGRLTVRERIERLLDPDSFHETGALAGVGTYEDGRLVGFRPANFVMGTGRIQSRRVVVGGDDFTVRGGANHASIAGKQATASGWPESCACPRPPGRRHGRRGQREDL